MVDDEIFVILLFDRKKKAGNSKAWLKLEDFSPGDEIKTLGRKYIFPSFDRSLSFLSLFFYAVAVGAISLEVFALVTWEKKNNTFS